jgi:DNA topoisomerase-2
MVLANGAEGIGTGWATMIPQFSPLDLVENLRAKLLTNRPFKRMIPWYRGYTGSVKLLEETNTYLFTGNFKAILPDRLEINELPIRKWTRDYKKFLEELA